MSLFRIDHKSPEPNVRIRLDSWRIVSFSTHSMIVYDSVKKQVRKSYELTRDSARFGLSRHDTVPILPRCAITYLEILQKIKESITN